MNWRMCRVYCIYPPEPPGFKPTIHSGRLLRAQLTTCTSGAGGRPTQCKHSTLLPFFLCWPHIAKTHPTRRCNCLPHWLAYYVSPTPSLNYSHSQNIKFVWRFSKRIFVFCNSVNDPSLEILYSRYLI